MRKIIVALGLVFVGHAAHAQTYRPDFDCSRVNQGDSIALMLCQNSDAAKAELQFDQVYYALRQAVGKSGWKTLKQQAIIDQSAFKDCINPFTPDGSTETPEADPSCYIEKIAALTTKYRDRLSGPSLEEASRPLEQHIQLQQKLIDLGYLPATSKADGIYGEATRKAIAAWQSDAGMSATDGFLDNISAENLLQAQDKTVKNTPVAHEEAADQPVYQKRETTDIPSKSNGFSFIFTLSGIIVFIILFYFFPKYIAHKNYESALSLVKNEIERQKRNLQIARTQKITKDAYGTYKTSDWFKEIGYFIETRLNPIIESRVSGESMQDALRQEAAIMIEKVASVPLPVTAEVDNYRSDPSVFDPRMNPFDYEQYCALLLRSDGWDSFATQKSGDQGADVIASKNGVKIVVQCKLYTGTVGNDAVQQAYTAQTFQGAQGSIVASNSNFSQSARQASATTGVMLVHHTQLTQAANDILMRVSC